MERDPRHNTIGSLLTEQLIGRSVADDDDQRIDQVVSGSRDRDATILESTRAMAGTIVELIDRIEAQQRQFVTLVQAFGCALDARDAVGRNHSLNVSNYAMGIGVLLGLGGPQLEWLRVAAPLADLGKIGTPDRILSKPGLLEPHERDEMKKHAAFTRSILAKVVFTDEYADLAELAAAHHERLDGSGYPDALAGNEIPLKARILAVADVFSALTHARHHRPGMAIEEAVTVLEELSPAKLDSRCVDALKKFLNFGPLPTPAA
jgi:HD-GYP domain-containing protein (c-di-GMP phosphodiesterase class II)